MTGRAWRALAVMWLIVLTLPAGLCLIIFTPMAIDMLSSGEQLSRSIGALFAWISAAAFLVAAVTIYFAVRIFRTTRVNRAPSLGEPS